MRGTSRALLHVTAALSIMVCFATAQASDVPLPSGSNVIQRLLERGEKIAKASQPQRYTYDKRAILEELNEAGKVIKSTEKLYKVVLINGLSFPRLVKIQGRDLTPAELEKQNKREEEFRKKVSRVDVKRKAEKKESWATDELVSKFIFKTLRREIVNGRPTLAIGFTPKAKPGTGKSIEDRVLSCIAGTVWVDEEDAEFSRLETKLRDSISMGWFGMFGSLSRLDIVLTRARMADGVWVNTGNSFTVVARKLIETMRTRTTEECSGFKRE